MEAAFQIWKPPSVVPSGTRGRVNLGPAATTTTLGNRAPLRRATRYVKRHVSARLGNEPQPCKLEKAADDPFDMQRRRVVLGACSVPLCFLPQLEALALEEEGPENSALLTVPSSPEGSDFNDLRTQAVATEAETSEGGIPKVTRKVFFDVAKDGEPLGRIVVGLYGQDVPIGAARFAELAIGKRGVSYKKREFLKITDHYVQNAGIRTFSVGSNDRDTPTFTGGETAEALIQEMSERRIPELKHTVGSVSLVAIDLNLPKPKQKLVARAGGLEMVEEVSRPPPNGTSFTISFADSPELDGISLVVGRVVEGMEVVETISKLPAVRENSSSPYFRAAKLIGDTRAEVAERGFNRPYNKIIITKCGEIQS